MSFNFNAVMGALSAYEDKFVDILTTNAMNTFVYTSLGDINQNLRRGVIADELHDTRLGNIKKLDADAVSTLKDHLTEKGRGFVDSYHDDLMKGGRFVNVGQWGAPGADGVHPYIGYDRKWVPWLEQYNQNQRAAIGDIITSGKMKDEIRDDLNTVFKERKVYSDLVARTEVGNNANIIRRDRYIQAGYNEFMWVCSPSTNSPCQIMCAQFCGKIYTKDNLPMNGEKAHPHCVLPDTEVFSPSGFQAATKMLYHGKVIRLNFASGYVTVTPNHMFLTDRGFACADVLMQGDNIINCSPLNREFTTHPQDNNCRGFAEDVFNSLIMNGGMTRSTSVPTSPEYLHGDARFGDKNIDIIFMDGFLGDNFKPFVFESGDDNSFSGTDNPTGLFVSDSDFDSVLCSLAFSQDRGMSSTRYSSPVFWGRMRHSDGCCLSPPSWCKSASNEYIFNGSPTNSGIITNFKCRIPPVISGDDIGTDHIGFSDFRLTSISNMNPTSGENFENCVLGDTREFLNLIHRFSGDITIDNVVSIEVLDYFGHVYDFQTNSSLYISNGYINSNCKCNAIPVKKSTYRGEYDNLDVASSSAKGKELISQGYKVDEEYPSVIKMNQNIPGIKPVEKIMPTSPVDITKPVQTLKPAITSTGKEASIMNRAVYAEEAALNDLKYEKLICFDDNGNVIATVGGDKRSIAISSDLSKKMRGNTVTHNHPGKMSALDFSDNDLKTAGTTGMKEMRVVCDGRMISLKKADGSNFDDNDAIDLQAYRKVTKNKRMNAMRNDIDAGKLSLDDVGAEQGRYWLNSYADYKKDKNKYVYDIVDLRNLTV